MRALLIIVLVYLSISSCKESPTSQLVTTWQETDGLQQLLDTSKLIGSIIVYDTAKDLYMTNDVDDSHTGHLPASTFKIANSLIALETGIVASDSTIIPWNGEQHYLDIWEQDMTLRDAFHRSCVPCYQGIARQVGVDRMRSWLDTMGYGSIVFDSTTVDDFWLTGPSEITPYEQIDFLRKLDDETLPLSDRTYSIFKKMMIVSDDENGILRAKTGWSTDDSHDNGWYVGYREKANNTIFFVINISPSESYDMSDFSRDRIKIANRALDKLGY